MVSKRTEIDFGSVFVHSDEDLGQIIYEIEKAVNVNGNVIIENGAYKHRQFDNDRPVQVKVIIETVGA